MLLAYAGTVLLMPFMVPWLATGFTAHPWTIAMCILAICLGAILSGFAAAAVLRRYCAPAGRPA
jgi:uncharacterized membrane protein (DUF485 family)